MTFSVDYLTEEGKFFNSKVMTSISISLSLKGKPYSPTSEYVTYNATNYWYSSAIGSSMWPAVHTLSIILASHLPHLVSKLGPSLCWLPYWLPSRERQSTSHLNAIMQYYKYPALFNPGRVNGVTAHPSKDSSSWEPKVSQNVSRVGSWNNAWQYRWNARKEQRKGSI